MDRKSQELEEGKSCFGHGNLHGAEMISHESLVQAQAAVALEWLKLPKMLNYGAQLSNGAVHLV